MHTHPHTYVQVMTASTNTEVSDIKEQPSDQPSLKSSCNPSKPIFNPCLKPSSKATSSHHHQSSSPGRGNPSNYSWEISTSKALPEGRASEVRTGPGADRVTPLHLAYFTLSKPVAPRSLYSTTKGGKGWVLELSLNVMPLAVIALHIWEGK